MAKGFYDQTDNTKAVGNRKEWEDGTYTITGIVDFFGKAKAKDGDPLFVPDSWSGQLVTRVKLDMEGTGDGPPYTMNRSAVTLLVKAFGADISKLPAGETTKFLYTAQNLIDAAETTIQVIVKKGWVSFVEGSQPEEAMYTWKVAGMYTMDGTEPLRCLPKTLDNNRGGTFTLNYLFLTMEIVGDLFGKPSSYDGWQTSMQFHNPFTEEPHINDVGEKELKFAVGEENSPTTYGNAFKNFIRIFCPNLTEHDWEANPTKSPYSVDETEYPFVVVKDYALKASMYAISKLSFTDKGYSELDLNDFIPSDQKEIEESSQPSELAPLINFIENQAKSVEPIVVGGVFNFVEDKIGFTDQGIEWLKVNVLPIWDKSEGFPTTRNFDLLSSGQCTQLLEALQKKWNAHEEEQGF